MTWSDELYHYGRKGMKWGKNIFGKERPMNSDGTPERYISDYNAAIEKEKSDRIVNMNERANNPISGTHYAMEKRAEYNRNKAIEELAATNSGSAKQKRWRNSFNRTMNNYRSKWKSGAQSISDGINKSRNYWKTGAREIGSRASIFGNKWTKGVSTLKANWKKGYNEIGDTVGSLIRKRR